MHVDPVAFLQKLLDDYTAYVGFEKNRYGRKMDMEEFTSWNREREERQQSLMKRTAMAHALIAATGYNAAQLNLSATTEPLVMGTKNILLVAIGAFQHGVAQPPAVTGRYPV